MMRAGHLHRPVRCKIVIAGRLHFRQQGPLTFRASVDVPARFKNSKAVGAAFEADAVQISIGRDQPIRRNIEVRGRDGAGDALRGGSYHAGAFDKMVLAQGLGHKDRQEARDEEGDRGAGTQTGCGHAPHVDGWHRVPMHKGRRSGMSAKANQRG